MWRFFSKRSKPAKRTPRTTKPTVQRLEGRKLMAADIGFVDGVISIQGSESDDVAEVYADGGSIAVSVSTYDSDGTLLNQHSDSFAPDVVDSIVFQAGAGDDLLVNDTAIDSIMRAGGGNDTLLGGEGNDILAAGVGDDVVLGGGGSDVVLGGPGDNIVIPSALIEDLANENVGQSSVDSQDVEVDVETDDFLVEDTALTNNIGDEIESDLDDASSDGELVDEQVSSPEESSEELVVIESSSDDATGDELVVAEVLAGAAEDVEPVDVETEDGANHGFMCGDDDVVESVIQEIASELEDIADAFDEFVVVEGDESVDFTEAVTEEFAETLDVVEELNAIDEVDLLADANETVADESEFVSPETMDETGSVQSSGEVDETQVGETDDILVDEAVADEVTIEEENSEGMTEEVAVENEVTEGEITEVMDPVTPGGVDVDAIEDGEAELSNDVGEQDSLLDDVSSPEVESDVGSESNAETQPSEESDDDLIFGGDGNDLLFGEGGDDVVFGGDSPLDVDMIRDLVMGNLNR